MEYSRSSSSVARRSRVPLLSSSPSGILDLILWRCASGGGGHDPDLAAPAGRHYAGRRRGGVKGVWRTVTERGRRVADSREKYDMWGYRQNFDEQGAVAPEREEYLPRSFSARYARPRTAPLAAAGGDRVG